MMSRGRASVSMLPVRWMEGWCSGRKVSSVIVKGKDRTNGWGGGARTVELPR